jgi:hypothetical protein
MDMGGAQDARDMAELKGICTDAVDNVLSIIMTATETAPDVYLVTEADDTWRELLAKCQKTGHLILTDSSGTAFALTPAATRLHSRPTVTKLPNFAARRAKLGTSRLSSEAEAEFFRELRGE